MDESGEHGLVATEADQVEGLVAFPGPWNYQPGASFTPVRSIGAGASNTATLVSEIGEGEYAAAHCNDLVHEGFDDWFLPSANELEQLCLNLHFYDQGDLDAQFYWSSSDEERIHNATLIQMSDTCGLRTDLGRSMVNGVRCVRAF